jgi:glycine betaine/proline transport system substrate-binding protein
VPLWHPQYLHAQHKIRALKEPQGLLRPVDQARLVIRKELLAKLSTERQSALLAVLGRVTLGNVSRSALASPPRSILTRTMCISSRL